MRPRKRKEKTVQVKKQKILQKMMRMKAREHSLNESKTLCVIVPIAIIVILTISAIIRIRLFQPTYEETRPSGIKLGRM